MSDQAPFLFVPGWLGIDAIQRACASTVAVHRCSSNSCTEVCARTSTFANGRLLVFQATVPGSYPLRAA
jgi:hypothetical protein